MQQAILWKHLKHEFERACDVQALFFFAHFCFLKVGFGHFYFDQSLFRNVKKWVLAKKSGLLATFGQ